MWITRWAHCQRHVAFFFVSANFPDEVVEHLPEAFDSGIYYGWAKVDNGGIHKMVMSVGWNPYYKNTKRSMVSKFINEARHKKTDFKVFVVVIPKEGLAGWGRQSFFGYGLWDIFICSCIEKILKDKLLVKFQTSMPIKTYRWPLTPMLPLMSHASTKQWNGVCKLWLGLQHTRIGRILVSLIPWRGTPKPTPNLPQISNVRQPCVNIKNGFARD